MIQRKTKDIEKVLTSVTSRIETMDSIHKHTKIIEFIDHLTNEIKCRDIKVGSVKFLHAYCLNYQIINISTHTLSQM